jgi:phosphatidylglycerophosphate synthase
MPVAKCTGPVQETKDMTKARSYLAPNLVIATRVAMAFLSVALLSGGSARLAVVGLLLIVVGIALDGVDGLVARRLGLASPLGSVLDITADRIVELSFWIFFAVDHRVPLWVPLVIATRGILVDAARSLALVHGKTAFGHDTMMRSTWSRVLTSSRFMRTSYGTAKLVAFVLLGALIVAAKAGVSTPAAEVGARFAVMVTVALCLARGVPVLWDSRSYLRLAGAGGPGGVGVG